jgi:hypothetical protein
VPTKLHHEITIALPQQGFTSKSDRMRLVRAMLAGIAPFEHHLRGVYRRSPSATMIPTVDPWRFADTVMNPGK